MRRVRVETGESPSLLRVAVRRANEAGLSGAIERAPIQRGRAGIQQLVDRMQAQIQESEKDPGVQELARRIVRHVRPGNYEGEVLAIYDYLAGEDVPYRLDPVLQQRVMGPLAAANALGVDCKNKTVLGGALLESIGHQVRVVTADQRVRQPGPSQDHHTYLEVRQHGATSWRPFDPVLRLRYPKSRPGQELPTKSRTVWRVP